jgi:hypothetical protein
VKWRRSTTEETRFDDRLSISGNARALDAHVGMPARGPGRPAPASESLQTPCSANPNWKWVQSAGAQANALPRERRVVSGVAVAVAPRIKPGPGRLKPKRRRRPIRQIRQMAIRQMARFARWIRQMANQINNLFILPPADIVESRFFNVCSGV